MYLSLNRAIPIGTLAFIITLGFPFGYLRGSEAAVLETSLISGEPFPDETTTSSPNPWPTDTTYTYSSQNECVVTAPNAPSGDCTLPARVNNSLF
ncbi:hypothetical protein GGR55DRAFT_663151 [Xylaria sp. FL0064]|nr:hypothetical protein GGR55DRAFT_663151 [Xylaria sp. FL0064]